MGCRKLSTTFLTHSRRIKVHMGTTWRQHGDNMRTMWRQHQDHGDVETTWRQHGDNMGTT